MELICSIIGKKSLTRVKLNNIRTCAKIESGDPMCAPAEEIFHAATRGGAQAFGLDAGEIRPGAGG